MNPKKKKTQNITKPFLKGKPTDEYTVKNSLKFFGIMIMILFMVFIVCSMTGFDNNFLRIAINIIIEVLILIILFNRGSSYGVDSVARGEILFQHVEKGLKVTENEKRIPFHPVKGFLIGFLGTVIIIIPAVILSLTTSRQMTGAGTIPGWMDAFTRRTEIGNALVAYTNPTGLGFSDILRIIVRITILPFINLVGTENKDGLLLIEKISPFLLLLPALSYGFGYLQGRNLRSKIHTEIAENTRKRIKRENKKRKERKEKVFREPQQLN